MFGRGDIYLDFVRDVVRGTLETERDIHAALAAADPQRLFEIVHDLKSQCAGVGAAAVAELCADLEISLQDAQLDNSQVEELLRQWRLLQQQLLIHCPPV
jgi:HPt (histidine-containing phosphotransfer) domain-containing protein